MKGRRLRALEFGKLGYEGRDVLPALREAANGTDAELRDISQRSIAKIESAERDAAPPEIDPQIHDII